MKCFKKVICGIASIVMCLSMTHINVSAATTYLRGDVNGDGQVLVNDLTMLSSFLVGTKGTNSGTVAERLDYNQDGIIDINDLNSLKKVVLGIDAVSTTVSVNTSGVPAQSNNRRYYVYDANGDYLRDYYLNSVDNISTNNVSTRSIIDADDRYLDNTLKGVVRFHYKDNNNGFTGFIVDEHTILTAAHCISQNYVAATPSYSYDIEFFNEDGSRDTSITATPVEYHIPYQFMYNKVNTDMEEEYYDYALITVEEDLSEYICFNLGIARNNIRTQNPDIYVTGFSNTYLTPQPNLYRVKSTAHGILKGVTSYNLYYDTDTTGGDSGAPVYVIKNGVNTVIGIHAYGIDDDSVYNHCTRITTDILHFVYNNSNLNY